MPAAAVTGLLTVLTRASGAGKVRTGLVAAAALAGQLSIGWANDALDADRDALRGRRDKPVATGALSRSTAGWAAGVAAVACVPLSLALGRTAGIAHLVAVSGGWAYDLGLKRTRASVLPYAVSFALFPLAAHRAVPGNLRTPAWLPLTGSLLGCGAHLLNALPDLADDAATGVRSLPLALGPTGCRRGAAALLAAAALVPPLADPAARPRDSARLAATGGTAAAVALAVLSASAPARRAFPLALASAGLDIGLLAVRGGAWRHRTQGIPGGQPDTASR